MKIELIKKELDSNGFAVCHDFLQGQALIDLQTRCDGLLDNTLDSDYKFGKSLRIRNLEENRITNPAISAAFESEILENIKDKAFPDGCGFTEIFITHEFTDEEGLARNGYLHFDRIWTFKYFYYLTDVKNSSDGPLRVVPKSHHLGVRMRSSQVGKPYELQKNRIRIDYPEIYKSIKDEMTPIFGNAGTLIIFDTDTFHMGGIVSNNGERKICRLHMRK
tara:strand:+ start:18514 stop:19173 length:660 start_codon:yes stop_codon:yes gene_type:complete